MARTLRGWMPRILALATGSTAVAAAAATASTSSSSTTAILSAPDFLVHSRFPLRLSVFPTEDDGANKAWSTLVAAQQGLLRSSRAIYTFAMNSYDYKYSLRGYEEQSPEYYSVRSEVHMRAARRLLELCEANKGFYVKAGQMLGSMQNIPKEFGETLSVLQDQARSWPYQAIKSVLVREFGRDVGDIFAEFDEVPIAAASLAQVHHAVLKSGEEVAVKVQYPRLQQQFQIDINTMIFLSKAVAWLFPDYQFQWIVPEFEQNISRELNFIMEGKNAEHTGRNFIGNNNVKVPHINWDLTTERVLTMEFMSGCKVDDVQGLKKAGIDQLQVAELLVEVFAEMMFCHGFVHGDPHPGNILISPQHRARGKRNFDLVLLDHGLYRELDEDFRANFCRLWRALILLDPDQIAEAANRIGASRYYRYLPVIFTGRAMGSKGGLGKGMTSEEKTRLKAEVQHFTMADVSEFMEGLPRDLLTVLRTDGLLKSITHRLGAEPRMRLMTNAKYAVMGLSLDHRGGPDAQGWQAQTKAVYDYANIRFRLELFDLSYRFGLFYNSLLRKVRSLFKKTCGMIWKINVVPL